MPYAATFRKRRRRFRVVSSTMIRRLLLPVLLGLPATLSAGLTPDSLAPLLAVSAEGQGNPAAAAAWKSVTAQASLQDIPTLLAAMDQANPLAANWLRGAVFTIADRSASAGQPLPPSLLTAFLENTAHGPAGRLLAAELLQQTDSAAWDALVPGLLEDPVSALRRQPVARLTAAATAAKDKPKLRQALNAARDEDQVRAAADELRQLGETVDLPRHYGFLMDWQVIGPFDNRKRAGFETVFPPEEKVDLAAEYHGKELTAGTPNSLRWQPWTSPDEFGVVDLNKPLGMIKEVTGYAATTWNSPAARPAELRLGSKNAWKLWFNGKLLFARDEYHRGMKIDQYRFPVDLKEGPNEILVKLCQNEQNETWTVEWNFQLRICDASGTAILDPGRPPTPEAAIAGKK